MPKLKKISVEVCTAGGILTSLGTEIGLSSTLCESYILSQTGTRFGIVVKPDDSFFAPDIIIDQHTHPDRRGGNRPEDYPYNPSEWHLLAEVYLGECLVPEATTIVYLPWHVRAEERLMDSSITSDGNGKVIERLWYFQEVGLENFVKTLSMSDPDAGTERAPTGETASDFSGSNLLEMMQNLRTERSKQESLIAKPGQIRVALRKIRIVGSENLKDQAPIAHERKQTNVGNSSHMIQIGEALPIKFSKGRHLYKFLDEDIYARFVFNYRSADHLKKMKLLQTERNTRRGVEDVVQFLRPLTFNEQVKQSELSELSGQSRKYFPSTMSLCKMNDQGLRGQHILELSIRESYTAPKPISKLAVLHGHSGFETGSLCPKSLEGGNIFLEKTAVSIINYNSHNTKHGRKKNAGAIVCGSNNFGGKYHEPLASTGGLGPVTTDNFKPEGSFSPVFGTNDSLSSPLAWAPNLHRSLSEDTESRGNYTTSNPTHRVIGHSEGPSRRDKHEIVVQTQVLVAPSYQGAQVTKRFYSSENQGDITEPNVKRSRRME